MGGGASKDNGSNNRRSSSNPKVVKVIPKKSEFKEVEIKTNGHHNTSPGGNRGGGGAAAAGNITKNAEGRRSSKPSAGEGSSSKANGNNTNRYARHATTEGSTSKASKVSSMSHGQSVKQPSKQRGDKNRSDMQDSDVVFETFVHQNGREFICAIRGGRRYYLDDWHSHEWQPFPERWYTEGILTPMDDGNNRVSSSQEDNQQYDDREGYLKHPKRGRVETYLMEERHYVHFFYDRQSGRWLRLPIGWELRHHLVKQMVDSIEEAAPDWKDRADILALLRACNYNPEECIATYFTLVGDDWLRPQRTSKDAQADINRNQKNEELTAKVKKLEAELASEKKQRREVEKQLVELQEKFSNITAEATSAMSQVASMQQSRPMTARPKTPAAVPVPVGAAIEDLERMNKKLKGLRKSHIHLKMDVLRNIGSLKAMLKELTKATNDLENCDSGSQLELEEIRALYQKEAIQRKLLYNQLQELRGNIRVFCRPRRDDRNPSCLKFPSDQDIMVFNQDGSKKSFNFDKVFTPDSSQEQIFTDTQPIITSCVDGYNVCLLAYGQTGSGKTFTMMGPDNNPGINIRAIGELLKICDERSETKTYSLKVSMVEIYNETVQDLLTSSTEPLELQMVLNTVRIPNMVEMEVKNVKDIKKIMDMGDSNRKVASTKMNSTSSRSHLVLMITVQGRDKITEAVSKGVLTLCDLAGSERISKTEATGQRLVEAAAINKSLSALGQVFTALRGSQMHIPYRNSKLTQILRPCLGGDAKACLFVNISPDVKNYQESCNTMEFGSNARQVALGQAKQNVSKKSAFPPLPPPQPLR